ncbi:MAG TPA: glycoside hydrolase family 2 TIM barrel-domain containing protein, partial [Bacteroidales bacterium]|nr:glycoside hydrolase family 2 TIM barrel-domain containing protein [Bacteroidales bacterium]
MKQILNLSECNWRFRNVANKTWHNATVPGCVHTDLYRNRMIPDPFFALNEKKMQWIENEDWEYRCEFEFEPERYSQESFNLLFKGLDTYAEVILNGQHLFDADNMFVPWEYDVSDILHQGTNELAVLLRSPFRKGLEKYTQLPYQLPANNDEHQYRVSPFTRKAPYMYGWDWGPRLLTSGIWKDVVLAVRDEAWIDDVNINTLSLEPSQAVLSVDTAISSTEPGQYRVQVFIDNEQALDLTTSTGREESIHTFRVKIRNPKLWWPRGFGDPNLYSFRIVLLKEEKTLDEYLVDTGIRTVDLVRESGKVGSSFKMRVNGKDIFIRGANIIPVDYFVSSVKNSDYDELTDNAVAVNMNMLRAWGGGVYEDDYFYRLCDRKGLLVWQDFMFACGMYPSDDAYLASLDMEIRHQVRRLRNHPSVVLWCGNNEVLEGYHTWGWKDDLGAHAGEAYSSYNKVFNEFIPGILHELDPSRPYWPTSPYSGDTNIISLESGDFHYWDIVKQILPITVYKDN